LPRETWESVFHITGGGRDAAVLASVSENTPPDGQAPAGHTEGKSIFAVLALLDLNGQVSRGDLFADAEVPAVTNPPVVLVLFEEESYDSDMDVPRGPVNYDWRNVVIEYSRGRKYSGLSYLTEALDNESRLQQYKFRVQQAIKLC
jgi:hypothetical protein